MSGEEIAGRVPSTRCLPGWAGRGADHPAPPLLASCGLVAVIHPSTRCTRELASEGMDARGAWPTLRGATGDSIAARAGALMLEGLSSSLCLRPPPHFFCTLNCF